MKMQFKTLAFAIIAFAIVVMTGCDKADDNPSGGSDNGSLSLSENGVSWTAAKVTAAHALGLITVSGEDDSDQEIIFLLPETITTGTYNLPSEELGSLSITYVTTANMPMYPVSGSLIITKHNTATNEFEGTFNFEASPLSGDENVSVTNGKFDVKYGGAK
jgi:hypothetical protein